MLTKNFARIWGMYCVGAPNNTATATLKLVSNKNKIFNNDLFQSTGFYILRNENLVLNDFDLIKDNQINNKCTLMVGSSLIPESRNDLDLLEPITTLTPISISSSYPNYNDIAVDEASYFYSISKTYRNETDKTIIVNEIGLYSNMVSRAGYGKDYYLVLLARKVLDTPIIFNPGDIYTVTFNLDI